VRAFGIYFGIFARTVLFLQVFSACGTCQVCARAAVAVCAAFAILKWPRARACRCTVITIIIFALFFARMLFVQLYCYYLRSIPPALSLFGSMLAQCSVIPLLPLLASGLIGSAV